MARAASSTKLPQTDSFVELHSVAQQSATLRKEFFKRLVNSYKCPVEVASADLDEYAGALMNACANGKPWIDLITKTTIFVEKCFGTHTSKFPNANIVLSEAAMMAHMKTSSVGVVSSNTALTRPYLCAGNAIDIPAQRLLCAVMRLDGHVVPVARDLAAHGPIFQIIRRTSTAIIEPLDRLASRIDARLKTPSRLTSAINKNEKHGIPTIFFPVGHDEYHLLTPVSSVPMVSEVYTRQLAGTLKLRRHDISVGGKQPQNAGLLPMDKGGFIDHFLSLPPPVTRRKPLDLAPLLRRLQRLIDENGTIVRNNIKVKRAQDALINRLVDAVVTEMLDSPHGDPVIPTLSRILEQIDTSVGRLFALQPDYLGIFRDVYAEALSETASRQVAELKGIV